MIRILASGLALTTAVALGAAQTLTTNAQGQRVIVYPDGTTRLFDAPPEDTLAAVGAPTDPTAASPADPAAVAAARSYTPAEELDALEQLRERIGRLEDELKDLTRIAKKARGREAKLANTVRKLRASGKIDDRSQLEIVTQQLIAARATSATAEEARASTADRVDALRHTLTMSTAKRIAYLERQGYGYILAPPPPPAGPTASEQSPPTPPMPNPTPVLPDELATDATTAADVAFARYDRGADTRYVPPRAACTFASDGVDEFTGKRRVALAPAVFFTYTSPDLKPFLRSDSQITCEAFLTRAGKSTVLEAHFTIRSQFASKEFGVLARGSQLTLKAVSGQRLTLKNQIQSQAEYDPVEKVSTYRGRYALSRSARKFLEDALLDEVRVMWGAGFDDYPVYDLTFLQRQLTCLDEPRA